jgi:hypothetical protein
MKSVFKFSEEANNFDSEQEQNKMIGKKEGLNKLIE